jgi:coiled-coil and C2 domain-containing protein 1
MYFFDKTNLSNIDNRLFKIRQIIFEELNDKAEIKPPVVSVSPPLAPMPEQKKAAPAIPPRPLVEPTVKPVEQPSVVKPHTPSPPKLQPMSTTAAEVSVDERELFKAPAPASTTLGALEQLNVEFQRRLTQADESDDSAKKRRYQRLVKQVNDAIKATKLNKPFNYEELNGIIPPGFSPIPLMNGKPVTSETQKPQSPIALASNQQAEASKPTIKPQPKSQTNSNPKGGANPHLKELRERQALFKEAAIEAKRSGNDKVAVLYLKNSKVWPYCHFTAVSS